MPKQLAVVVGSAALLAAVTLWLLDHQRGSTLGPPQAATSSQPGGAASPPTEGQIQSADAIEHRTQARTLLRVVDENGQPIQGIRVDRIPRPCDWRRRVEGWPRDEDADVRAATQAGVTDSSGLVDVPDMDPGLTWDGSLMWVRTPGRRAAWLAFPNGTDRGGEVRELRAPACKDVEVAVIDIDGRPVAGAVVTERAFLGDWLVIDEDERSARQFDFLPRVSTVTNALGVAILPVFPGKSWIQATASNLASSAWTGIGPRRVTLRVVATCEIEGRVVDESGAGVPAEGAVSCQLRRGFDGLFLTLAPIREGGRFGPVQVPLDTGDGFILQYFGGEFEAAQVSIAPPEHGAREYVEIRTRPGLGVELRVSDEEGRPLSNAQATTQWTRNGEWRRVDRRTNDKGLARLTNLPNGEVWVKVRRSGYVPELRQLSFAEDWVHHPLEITMRRAATVEGWCTSEGHPVTNFTVYFWKSAITDGGTVRVEDSEDGAFKIDEAAPGLVQLFASSSEVVQSASASLTVEAGAIGKAYLKLPRPRIVTAQVVEASSADPVSGAKVSVLPVVGQGTLKPWKSAQVVDADGRFELRGLGSVQGCLSIAADGFATRTLSVWAGESQSTDLGQIALHRAKSLLVQLQSSTPVDFASYGVTLTSGTQYLPGVRVSADGSLKFDGLAPGLVQLRLESSTGSTEVRSVRIRPAGLSRCVFDLDGEPLDIHVVPPSGEALPEVVDLGLRYVDRNGEQVSRWFAVPKSGEVGVGRIAASRVLLEVQVDGRTRLASAEFDVPTQVPRRIDFEMKSRPVRLRIVNHAHVPIVGASVFLTNRRCVADAGAAFTTDENGEILVPDAGPGDVSVSVVHTEDGTLPCVPLQAADQHGSALEIVVPLGKDVYVDVRDGQTALPLVEIELQDSCQSSMVLGRVLAGPDGRVHLPHLAPGDYRMLVDHPGIWRTEQPITVTATSTSFTVQLRRLGSARVHVKSGVGNPVEGASVELVDVATGVSIADWIQKGEVTAPPNGLRTDASGMLVVHGLPRGSYRCVISSTSGATLERTLEVPPQATGELEATLQ